MVRILFLCHGNICRSVMGEYILKDMVKKAGVSDRFEIDSAAVSREEIGNSIYPPATPARAAGLSVRHAVPQWHRDAATVGDCRRIDRWLYPPRECSVF